MISESLGAAIGAGSSGIQILKMVPGLGDSAAVRERNRMRPPSF